MGEGIAIGTEGDVWSRTESGVERIVPGGPGIDIWKVRADPATRRVTISLACGGSTQRCEGTVELMPSEKSSVPIARIGYSVGPEYQAKVSAKVPAKDLRAGAPRTIAGLAKPAAAGGLRPRDRQRWSHREALDKGAVAGGGLGVVVFGELDEVVEGLGVGEGVAADDLGRVGAGEDPLDGDLDDLAGEGAGDRGDLADLVGDVAGGAALADRAGEGLAEVVVEVGALAEDDEELDHAVGALLREVDDEGVEDSSESRTAR